MKSSPRSNVSSLTLAVSNAWSNDARWGDDVVEVRARKHLKDKCLSLDDHKYGDWISAWRPGDCGDKPCPYSLSVVRFERHGNDWARASDASSSNPQ